MGWSIGWDGNWNRHVGYGVPAECDHPDCTEEIDRGLAYVCGDEPFGGDRGCGLYFCGGHLLHHYDEQTRRLGPQLCERCIDDPDGENPRFEPKPDVQEWIDWKLTDDSWAAWRAEHPEFQRAVGGDAR
jgi:hypothetical protein